MKIIKPNAEYIETVSPLEKIELAGRTCYKSEANITPDSAIEFVKRMLKSSHLAMLEHGNIIISCSKAVASNFVNEKYINVSILGNDAIISGSFRAFVELFNRYVIKNNVSNYNINAVYTTIRAKYPDIIYFDYIPITIDDDIKIICDKDLDKYNNPAIYKKHKMHTIKFTCDRGVSHEFVRHRPASFAQESTRYCNYSKDKFGNEITVIEPCFYEPGTEKYDLWKNSCEASEKAYFSLLENESTAQEARSVLPNSLKTEIVITANEEEWQHIVNLRYHGTTGKPHPQMVEVMTIAYDILKEKSNGRII